MLPTRSCPSYTDEPEPHTLWQGSSYHQPVNRRNGSTYTGSHDDIREQERDQGFQGQYATPDRLNSSTYFPESYNLRSAEMPYRSLNALLQLGASSQGHGTGCLPWDWSRYSDQRSISRPSVGLNLHNRSSHDASLSTGLGSDHSDTFNILDHPHSSTTTPQSSKIWSSGFQSSRLVSAPMLASSSTSTPYYPTVMTHSNPSFPESPNPVHVAQTLASLGEPIRQYNNEAKDGNEFSNAYSMASKACGTVSWASTWSPPMDRLHSNSCSNQSFHCHSEDHQAGICDGFKIDWLTPCHDDCDDYGCADDRCSSDDCCETDDCVTCHDAVVPCKDECPEAPCTEELCFQGSSSSYCQDYSSASTQPQHNIPQCAWFSNGTQYSVSTPNSEIFNCGFYNGFAERQIAQACEISKGANNVSGGFDASRSRCVCLVPNCTVNGRCFKDMIEYKQHFIDVHCHQHRSNSLGCSPGNSLNSRIFPEMCDRQDAPQSIRDNCLDTALGSDAVCSLELSKSQNPPRSSCSPDVGIHHDKSPSSDDSTSVSHTKSPFHLLASSEEAQTICKVRLQDDSNQLCGATFENAKDLHMHLELVHSKIKKEEGQKDFRCPWENCQKRILKLKPHYRTHSGCTENVVPP